MLGFETVAPRFVMALFSCFAFLGLILAAAGIYSVISYDVSQRVHEIGVRVALGATRSNVVTSVLRGCINLVSFGLVLGLMGAFFAVRLIRSQIFGAAPFDLASMLAICLLLSAVALLAGLIPARRAGRLDPLTAMRYEA
jgi:ABC-type antimicrobial peptide transport system permease subunit